MSIVNPHLLRNLWIILIFAFGFFEVYAVESSTDKLNRVDSTENQAPFHLRTVVIDAGHGGKDPGNISPWKAMEKDINLSIALNLAKRIHSETEYEVYLTRTTDRFLSLTDRAHFANQYPANQTLFVSIHCNSHINRKVHGLESYIFNLKATDQLAAKLAERENAGESVSSIDFIINNLYQRGTEKYSWNAARIVQSVLASQLKSRDRNRHAPDKRVRRAPFVVLAETNMPAILVELGFLSNKEEFKKLSTSDYQDEVAKSLLVALKNFDEFMQESTKNGIEDSQ